MRWDFVTLGFLAVGCSLTSMDSLDDNADASGYSGAGGVTGAGGGSNACVPSCERAVQAGCQSFSMQSCLSECQAKGANIPGACLSAYGTLLVCASESGSYICDSNGKAALINCSAEAAALSSCTNSGSGGTDAGDPDSSVCDPGAYLGATCADVNSATPDCEDCIANNCCGQVDSCFADTYCAGLYACASTCAGTPDFSQCVYDTCPACSVAVNAFNAISQCVYDNCSVACS